MTAKHYSQQLRELIFDKNNGLIIDACDQRDADGVWTHNPNLAFRFPSTQPDHPGTIRRYYITLSGLFRGREALNECVKALAEAVSRFSDDNQRIDYLVTCGATGKYLIEYLMPRLYRKPKADPPDAGATPKKQDQRSHPRTLYLGAKPESDQITLPELNGKRCLIITDVIATGTWVRKMVQHLIDARADVVGCISVVDTGQSDDSNFPPQPDSRIQVPLVSLTSLLLPELSASDIDATNLIEVTPGVILNRLIADVRNNMLIGPQVSRNEDGSLSFSEKVLFRRVSGGYQRHFVTLWPLFEKLLCFDDLMDHLAEHARRLRNQSETYFSTIVTCTATGHHLLEHLQPRIETSKSPVEATYLGPYPYHALTQLPENAFKDKTVLILTDVVASMTLVKNIASVVHRLGGDVSAVLSVVTTLSGDQRVEEKLEYAPDCTAQIETFCCFDVQRVNELPSGFKSVDIDPETILPREEVNSDVGYWLEREPRAFKPFDFATTLRHFDESQALRIGIFEANHRYFTAGIRLPKLFERFGSEIWERIKPALTDQDLLVTTTDRDDLRFLDFVQKWGESEHPGLQQLLIPRYDSLQFDFPYFLPPSARQALNGKRILLLIHSAQISEKLRRLVSLLAQSPVKSVDVVCLLNRMGDYSADFVARIKQMTSGIGQERGKQDHRFGFHWVYMVDDLHGNELVGTLESIRHLADVYTKSSLSPVFRSLFAEEMRYFRLQSFLNRTIENESATLLQEKAELTIDNVQVRLSSFDAVLYAWFAHPRSLNTRNQQIRRLLISQTDRTPTYMVLLLVLAEISFLRSQKQVAELKSEITAAIAARRKTRLELEKEHQSNPEDDEKVFLKISDLVLQETALLFCYALISFLDSEPEVVVELSSTLTGNLSEHDWERYPLNFQAYYRTSRTLWCVSLLLFFAHLERALTNEDFKVKKQELINLSHRFQTMITNDLIPVKSLFGENTKTLKRRLTYPFDALLMDLEFHALDSRKSVLIFLDNRVGQRTHHNALCKDTKEALTILSHMRSKAAESVDLSPRHAVVLPQTEEEARQWKTAVDKATEAVAMLTIVGQAAAELFDWYRLAPKADDERFGSPDKRDSKFQNDISFVSSVLSKVRADSQISAEELAKVIRVNQRIEKDLAITESETERKIVSGLRGAVDYYQPPIRKKIIEEMISADKRLEKEFGTVWTSRADELRERANANTDDLVLVDPLLLSEILWNLFTNVHHGLTPGASVAENAAKVEYKIIVSEPESTVGGERARLRLDVISPRASTESPGKNDTWYRHRQEVKRYGGSLEYQSEEKVTQSLDLIRVKEIT